MFNLEDAIKSWRKSLKKHPGLEPGYVEELETHLREKIQELIVKGFDEETAFKSAVEQLDDPKEIATEYHVARTKNYRTPSWKQQSWIPTLLPNYIKMALRGFFRRKQTALINTAGLSIGLACCLIILGFIYHELSFDRFHPESAKLYRITYKVTNQGTVNHYAVSVPGLAPAIKNRFPEVESVARISTSSETVIRINDRSYTEKQFLYADSTFFQIFGFDLIQGNPQTALSGPDKVVLSQKTAQKYFGDQNPVGRTLLVDNGQNSVELEISGIAATRNRISHLEFDLLASFETLQKKYPVITDQNWWIRSVYTYLKLKNSNSTSQFEDKLPVLVDNYMKDMKSRSGSEYAFSLQPITDIHLYSQLQREISANGNITYLYLFGAVALAVLLIASINYMNLATARYSYRLREVGIRKSLGASRWSLMKQFYGESLTFSFIAVIISIILAWSSLPIINQLAAVDISLEYIDITTVAIGILSTWLVTGLIAGSYPALFLSSFESSSILKGTFLKADSGSGFRRLLVTVQFIFSIALIAGTGIIYQQLNYTENKPLGFQKQRVLIIPVNSTIWNQVSPETIKQEITQHSNIRQVAFASHYPTNIRSNNTRIRPENVPDDTQYNITLNYIDPNYKNLLKLDLKEGRNFIEGLASDTASYIINEEAARYFEWSEPVGESLVSATTGNITGKVIGVFRNFHQQSLHRQIEPTVFKLGSEQQFGYTLVKFTGRNIESTISFLEKQWEQFGTDRPFEYTFLDDRYKAQYSSERQLAGIISLFSGLAILIALLGLYGLVTFVIERRSKEIGIRKVFGANSLTIVFLLSRKFLNLVTVAFIISVPITWYLLHQWLNNFAYSVNIGMGIFLLAGGTAVAITWITVSIQATRAALANPVQSLREE